MPAPAGTKRVKGVSVFRPFGKAATSYAVHLDPTLFTDQKAYTTVFGSIARPIDPNKKPPDLPSEHTHQWTVWVKGVDDEDISYWLKKVQFKLHETYANSLRTVEGPPFEVTETGWGEFEIQIKLYFVPESNEKPQSIWHGLKLHPYGPDAEQQRERREPIISQNYEEVIFNEPVEQFYEILTGASVQPIVKGKGSKGSKLSAYGKGNDGGRTAEIPYAESPGNPYSQKTEGKELDRMGEAIKTVEQMVKEERAKLAEREAKLETLRKTEGVPTKKK